MCVLPANLIERKDHAIAIPCPNQLTIAGSLHLYGASLDRIPLRKKIRTYALIPM